jgi:hypothetical protein
MWNEINNNSDLKSFMEMFYSFHDSCIKEMKYLSGAYVNENLAMYPLNECRILRMIIQRQFKNNSMIEMEFSGLKFLKLLPCDISYTCEILDATMLLKNDSIYWCDCGGISETDLDNYDGTIICASKLRWRSIDEYLGSREFYTSII